MDKTTVQLVMLQILATVKSGHNFAAHVLFIQWIAVRLHD